MIERKSSHFAVLAGNWETQKHHKNSLCRNVDLMARRQIAVCKSSCRSICVQRFMASLTRFHFTVYEFRGPVVCCDITRIFNIVQLWMMSRIRLHHMQNICKGGDIHVYLVDYLYSICKWDITQNKVTGFNNVVNCRLEYYTWGNVLSSIFAVKRFQLTPVMKRCHVLKMSLYLLVATIRL